MISLVVLLPRATSENPTLRGKVFSSSPLPPLDLMDSPQLIEIFHEGVE